MCHNSQGELVNSTLITTAINMYGAPKYNNPPTGIKKFADPTYYSQTVDLGGGLVKAAGQGGWTIEEGPLGPIPESAHEQVENAFKNIDHVLKEAGLDGTKDIYLIRTYHMDVDETVEIVTKAFERWIGHRPVWTPIGVVRLGDKRMKIEIEVEAKRHD